MSLGIKLDKRVRFPSETGHKQHEKKPESKDWSQENRYHLRYSRNSEEGLGFPQCVALGDSGQFNWDHNNYRNSNQDPCYIWLRSYNGSMYSQPPCSYLTTWLPRFPKSSQDCLTLLLSPAWRSEGSGLGQARWGWERQRLGIHKAAKCGTSRQLNNLQPRMLQGNLSKMWTYLLLHTGELCVENLESRIFKTYQKNPRTDSFPKR